MSIVQGVVLLIVLLVLSGIDIRQHRLPDVLTLPLVALGLTLSALHGGWIGFAMAVFAAALGFLVFLAIAWLYRRARGHDGLGLGDAKLLAAAGAWLGPLWLAPVVFISATTALCCVLLLRLAGRTINSETRVPFGPFLACGLFSCWLVDSGGWAVLR